MLQLATVFTNLPLYSDIELSQLREAVEQQIRSRLAPRPQEAAGRPCINCFGLKVVECQKGGIQYPSGYMPCPECGGTGYSK